MDWAKYDIVIVGSPIVYGVYNKIVWEFCSMYKNEIESRPNSFFNVTVVARSPEKATPEGNRYLQKFVKRSAWKPRDLKCFAGKVSLGASKDIKITDSFSVPAFAKVSVNPRTEGAYFAFGLSF